jgi:hypothetical protein
MLKSPKRHTLVVRYDQQPLVFRSKFAAWKFKRKMDKSHWQIVPAENEERKTEDRNFNSDILLAS